MYRLIINLVAYSCLISGLAGCKLSLTDDVSVTPSIAEEASISPTKKPGHVPGFLGDDFGYRVQELRGLVDEELVDVISDEGPGARDFSISPELPPGLTFDADDGTIYGASLTAIPPTVFLVTAVRDGETVTTSVKITVTADGAE